MRLVEISEGDWMFEDEALTCEADEKLFEAFDYAKNGEIERAKRITYDLIRDHPNHIDAIHSLSIWIDQSGDKLDAYVYAQAAVAIGLQAIPPEFRWDRARLLWGHPENRPFLSAYCRLGYLRMEQDAWEDAIFIFNRIHAVNPLDNQAIRLILPECWFETGEIASIIEHCRTYDGDLFASTHYSLALAYVLVDHESKARDTLKDAIVQNPFVAKQILAKRHRRPSDYQEGVISLGGPTEAWHYWKCFGRHWTGSQRAMSLLREEAQLAKLSEKSLPL